MSYRSVRPQDVSKYPRPHRAYSRQSLNIGAFHLIYWLAFQSAPRSVVLNPGHMLKSPMKVKNKISGSTADQLTQNLWEGCVYKAPNAAWVENL